MWPNLIHCNGAVYAQTDLFSIHFEVWSKSNSAVQTFMQPNNSGLNETGFYNLSHEIRPFLLPVKGDVEPVLGGHGQNVAVATNRRVTGGAASQHRKCLIKTTPAVLPDPRITKT